MKRNWVSEIDAFFWYQNGNCNFRVKSLSKDLSLIHTFLQVNIFSYLLCHFKTIFHHQKQKQIKMKTGLKDFNWISKTNQTCFYFLIWSFSINETISKTVLSNYSNHSCDTLSNLYPITIVKIAIQHTLSIKACICGV